MGTTTVKKFSNAAELFMRLGESGLSLPELILARESFETGMDAKALRSEIATRIGVTRRALERGAATPQRSVSGMSDGAAARFAAAASSSGLPVADPLFAKAVGYSLAVNEVNACGGRIVAFPTAGSCGIVPGVLWAWRDAREPSLGPSDTRFQDAFIVASAIGSIIAMNASVAGASGGCQAECGSAAAMAAGALYWLMAPEPEAVFDAAALSLKNCLGLTCDPVAGLVEVPCVKRNGFMAANALTAACMRAAGIRSAIPFDEVVSAMKAIGDAMPASLKESAEGGLAVTPTGLAWKAAIERT